MIFVAVILAALGTGFCCFLLLRNQKEDTLTTMGMDYFDKVTAPLASDPEFPELCRLAGKIAVTMRLACPPYGTCPVQVTTNDITALSDSARQALKQLQQLWPTYWDTARVGLEMEVEEYGNSAAWMNNAIMLKASYYPEYEAGTTMQIGLSFEPFAGFYDVTIAGDVITDSGASF